MARPKGSKTKSCIDPKTIIETDKSIDENGNSCQSPVSLTKTNSLKVRSKFDKLWSSIVGSPIECFLTFKLPQNNEVIRNNLLYGSNIRFIRNSS